MYKKYIFNLYNLTKMHNIPNLFYFNESKLKAATCTFSLNNPNFDVQRVCLQLVLFIKNAQFTTLNSFLMFKVYEFALF